MNSELKPVRGELLRKLLHVILSILLLVPLTPQYEQIVATAAGSLRLGGDTALSTYTALLVIALLVSTLRIRKPELRESILRISREARRHVLQRVRSLGPLHEVVRDVEQVLDRAEQGFFDLLDALERDYEKRYGYMAAVCAVASTLASYVFFGPAATARGILALAVVDPVASLLTLALGRPRSLKHNPLSVLASALAFAAVLAALGEGLRSLLLGAAASLIELVSPEDNLTLPLGIAGLHYLLELAEP